MNDYDDCTITDEEFDSYKKENGDVSPCSEYGMCENCPWWAFYYK